VLHGRLVERTRIVSDVHTASTSLSIFIPDLHGFFPSLRYDSNVEPAAHSLSFFCGRNALRII
jgi:hypothetical protein